MYEDLIIVYTKQIDNKIYTKTEVTTLKDNKIVRYEITYNPRIKFGLELNDWILQN